MRRRFNVTGSCNSQRHFMVDISAKFASVRDLIDRGEYFAINRPRQFGKTTMLFQLLRRLSDEYLVLSLSFEGIGDAPFESEESFVDAFLEVLAEGQESASSALAEQIRAQAVGVTDLKGLSRFITRFVRQAERDVVLLIDEVDKSSNSQVFLSFLGMLRLKYLARQQGMDATFQSAVLAGVHDVKSLKLRVRETDETKLNSPWNIAADFNVDMSFSPAEIKTLLADYADETGVTMDMDAIAARIHYYTSGHPFLVSKLCKVVDEDADAGKPGFDAAHWTVADIDWAFQSVTHPMYQTTNFDDLIKNLENNQDLYAMVRGLSVEGRKFSASADNPVVGLAITYGILSERDGGMSIANRVYEQRIATYLQSKKETSELSQTHSVVDIGYVVAGSLNVEHVLHKFQEFMREHHSDRDASFLEREGRLIFMSFLKPIINGHGFMWKEPMVGDERRMDLVVTFGSRQKEVVELKIRRGDAYHQEGLQQLSDYLDFQGLTSGYLVIFDLRQSREMKCEDIRFAGKAITAVWV